MPQVVRTLGIRSGLASPIVVDGKLWGAITLASPGRSLPPGTERQLAGFTELIATALANAQARDKLSRLADEQAGLRRVATLVAQGDHCRAGNRPGPALARRPRDGLLLDRLCPDRRRGRTLGCGDSVELGGKPARGHGETH
jgi:hypothetical protein